MVLARQSLLSAGFGTLFLIAAVVAWFWPQSGGNGVGFDPMDDFCIIAPATPYDPASGLALDEPRPIPADARCPVCGMFPARYPRWAGQVIFSDGATHFFDSPVNLLVFLRDVARYSNYTAEDVIASYTNDVASDTWTPAETAYFVHGSDALGPMREGNLPSFAERTAAQVFAEARGGKVLAHREVDTALLDSLSHAAHHHHHH